MTQLDFEQTVKKVTSINNKLKFKGFNLDEIDAFWSKVFRLMPRIVIVGIDNIEVCTGCGRLNIEDPIKNTAMACCPDSNYKSINV